MNSGGPKTHQRFQKLREPTANKSTSKTDGLRKLSFRRKNLASKVLPPVETEIVNEAVASEAVSDDEEYDDEVLTTTLSTAESSTEPATTVAIATTVTGDDLSKVNATTVPTQNYNAMHEKFRMFRERNFLKHLGESAKENFDFYLHKEDDHKPNSDLYEFLF